MKKKGLKSKTSLILSMVNFFSAGMCVGMMSKGYRIACTIVGLINLGSGVMNFDEFVHDNLEDKNEEFKESVELFGEYVESLKEES